MELRELPRGPVIADEDAGRLLNAVLDGGINLIDTSPDYGRSEELIGRYVGHRRDEFFLASKCGCLIELPAVALPPYPPTTARATSARLPSSRCGGSVRITWISSWCTCPRARPPLPTC